MFTNLSTWVLKKYISFQFMKSGIKKLYKYSRTKKAVSRIALIEENKKIKK